MATEEDKKEERPQTEIMAEGTALSSMGAEKTGLAEQEGLSRLEAPAHSASGTAFLSLLHLTMLNLTVLRGQ